MAEKRFGRVGDLERMYGIKRSKACELIAAGKIRSAVVKKKYARSGIRLIDMQSVEDMLRDNMENANGGGQ